MLKDVLETAVEVAEDIATVAKEAKALRKAKRELKEQYFSADCMVEENEDLFNEMKEYGISSIVEFIVKQPYEAYIQGVIQDYDIDSSFTEEEANVLAEAYSQKITNQCNYIIDEVKRLGGDVEKVKSTLSIIPFFKN